MKLLVVGGGGREHAIIKKLKENPEVEKIYALPGNGGIADDAECVNIKAKDIEGIVTFAAENGVDYAVVAPDDPLVLGCVDALSAVVFHVVVCVFHSPKTKACADRAAAEEGRREESRESAVYVFKRFIVHKDRVLHGAFIFHGDVLR